MQALSDSWDWMKYVWTLITQKRHNVYRELTPMTRVYTKLEMVLFSFSITVGKTFFYRIPLCVLQHGDILMLFWIMYSPILYITAGCFAEMAALMPAAGAHYHYCYSTIGEIVAFLVGWHLIFAYTTLTLSRCKLLGEFIDHTMLDGWVSNNLQFMEQTDFLFFRVRGNVDIISPLFTITMAFLAVSAVKFTKGVVNSLTSISILVIFILIIAFTAKMEITHIGIGNAEDGEKLFDSLYTLQNSLIGYESLSVLGEEAKDPTTTIPQSIMVSVQILMVIYFIYTFTMSFSIKAEDMTEIDHYNPIGSIFIKLGWPTLYWIAAIGSVCGFMCSSYGSMFVSIRILYTMSRDGMIFKKFSKIDKFTKKPAVPALIFGAFTGIFVTFIRVHHDVAFPSLILAKTLTTVCLLITRYRYEKEQLGSEQEKHPKKEEADSWVLINHPKKTKPTKTTHSLSMILIYNSVMSALSSLFCFVILYRRKLGDITISFRLIGYFSILFAIIFTFLLKLQPTNDRTNLSFMTPYVPVFPLLAIIADVLSALILCKATWLFGLIWTGLGIAFYFIYSIHHSEESRNLYADGTRWNSLELHSQLDSISTSIKNRNR
ncbi:high affinity cationic amino acid transporter 1 isoform X1 [Halyomorpha halys]|uniref:high affinity cationic amino acid transporter 1 isoform X1 n=1 Tax=Halyomorpha halys TaxID=286706 RepID=UPI0006D4F893|nr:high affinity cationic amino acid transporter 1-like [Halyomorpha halys]